MNLKTLLKDLKELKNLKELKKLKELKELKELKKLKELKNLKESNSFGIIKDINFRGQPLRKTTTKNGTFFEIPVPDVLTHYGKGDLHLSVFEDSGIVTKHVAFKIKRNKQKYSFYYGKKHNLNNGIPDHRDYMPKFWTTPPGTVIPEDILKVLVSLYANIKPHIKIQRQLPSGEFMDPYTLQTHGTPTTRKIFSPNALQRMREYYQEHGIVPSSPLGPSGPQNFEANAQIKRKLVF